MNRRFRDFILATCILGTIGCYVGREFAAQQPLHHELNAGAGVFLVSALVVWLVL